MRSLRMVSLAIPLASLVSIAWAEPPPVFLGMWGTEGARVGELQYPTGVSFDSEGHLVVADSHNGRMQLFQTNGDPVELLRLPGTEPANMLHPQAVGVDASGRIFVSDSEGDCIWVFDRGGLLLGDWEDGGTGLGHFNAPGAIATTTTGKVLAADWTTPLIHHLDTQGTCQFEWTPGAAGAFRLATDPYGHIFVLDTGNDRVLKYDMAGNPLSSWGLSGTGPGEFADPQGIASDSRGDIYVADTYNYRIQKFSGTGRFISEWGSFGSGPGQFVKPVAIAVNDDGLIVVADELTHRMQLFGLPAQTTSSMDIMPGACPNVLGAGGTMQVALLGTATFDAFQVDAATVRFATLEPILYGLGDVSRPAADLLDPCACTVDGPDGRDDLVLTFDEDAVRSALGGGVPGVPVEVELTGALRDGQPFTAQGCVEIAEVLPALTAQSGRTALRLVRQTPTGFDIGFAIGEDGFAKLSVLDVAGRVVGRLANEWRPRGEHHFAWSTRDLKSGVYFLRLEAHDQVVVKRFSLAR